MEQGRRPVADGGGATPAALGRGERVGEHRWEVEKLARRLVDVGKRWRRGLDGGLGGGGGHGSRRSSGAQG